MSESRALQLNSPIKISDESVIFLLDSISSDKYVSGLFVRAASDSHGRVVLLQDDALRKARTDYGSIKTYGIWSTLIENHCLSKDEFQYLELAEGRGVYCLAENGVVYESGFYTGQQIPSRPDLRFEDGRQIPNSVDYLSKLPPPILTNTERAQAIEAKGNKTRKRRLYTLSLALTFGGAAGILNPIFFASASQTHITDQVALENLKAQLAELKKTRGSNLGQSQILSSLIWLSKQDEYMQTTGKILSSSSDFEVVFSSSSLVPEGADYSELPDGRAVVKWSTSHD